ncbi:MAG: carbohydrate kinase, partial [Anaerolineaceae bacterium]|nr:carbohydrate kinase [Anaerolineaceae bacterium]
MAEFLVGVDFGTGGTKATLIDTQGHVLGYAFEEYPIHTDKPGWSEHDASLYWVLFCKLVKKILSESNVNPAEIRGVAVSSALPSLVMVDQDHNPVVRAYNLMDRRATKEVAWLKEHIGEERIFKLTANRLEDHPSIVNLMWEKNNRPEVFKQIKKALTIDGFITLRLTGKATLHYSGAAFYGVAYNILQRRFENDILELAGISPDLIPALNKCDDIVGEITSQAAQETGLVKGTPVAGGQVDCNAGWLQGGAVEPGNIQMNLGTCGNFGIIHRNPEFLFSEAGAASINFAYTVGSENTYITVPTTTTGGQTIRYIRDNFSQLEVESEKHFGIDSYDLLNLQA